MPTAPLMPSPELYPDPPPRSHTPDPEPIQAFVKRVSTKPPRAAPKFVNWQNLLLAVVVVGGGIYLWGLTRDDAPLDTLDGPKTNFAALKPLQLKDIPFNGERAYDYLKAICAIGRRVSDSEGIAKHREQLKAHFEKQGAKVTYQDFQARNPLNGQAKTLKNIVVTWHPERNDRILLCAHYDTRPFPDQDRRNPRGTFLGANDGASGIAVMMEMGEMLPKFDSPFGVDFVFFDAEEWVFDDRDPYFLGSEAFAKEYVANPPKFKYRSAVLLDMVGGKTMRLPIEPTSWSWVDSRPLIEGIWTTAQRLGVTEFVDTLGKPVKDDHLALHDIAKIPTCDIIDFDYPHWHTVNDTPANCSPLSLAKVGWVLQEWLRALK